MNSPSPPNNHSTEILPIQNLDAVTPDDELLVAYLDNELSDADKLSLEQKLTASEALRMRLQQLRSAWDLLDELPATKPDPNFAQSTIEMVAMSAAELRGAEGTKSRAGRWWYAAWLLMPLMMLAGYAAVRAWYRFAERQAIEEVHLIADWDTFKTVGSYEWLEKLTTVKDLLRVTKRTSSSELGVGVVPQTVSDRRSWIASLSPTDRDRLSANLEDFKQFHKSRPSGELKKIVELVNRIYSSPHPEELLQVARSYAIFLSDMNATDRATHLDITDLSARVAELQNRVNRKLVEVYASELPTEAADKLAVVEWKKEKEAELYPSTFEEAFGDALQARMQFGEDLDRLIQKLSPETQEILGRLNDKGVQQLALIWYFIQPKPPRRQFDRVQAIDEFQRRSPEEQAKLEFLPPAKAQEELGVGR